MQDSRNRSPQKSFRLKEHVRIPDNGQTDSSARFRASGGRRQVNVTACVKQLRRKRYLPPRGDLAQREMEKAYQMLHPS